MEDKGVLSGDAVLENIKHFSDTESEFWYARELGIALGYDEWRDFYGVIKAAMSSCRNNNCSIRGNFWIFSKKSDDGEGRKKEVDYRLTVYACYLIAQKADFRRECVGVAQEYFTAKLYPELFAEEVEEVKEEKKARTPEIYLKKKTRGYKREQARQHINYSSYEFDEYKRKKFIKKQLLNSRGNICAICGKPITDMKDCTIDHIRPVSKGGTTEIENCQLAHRACNVMKGNDYEK